MEINSKIYVAGHTGMVGSAILRKLKKEGYTNIVGKTIDELDLTNQQTVIDFFSLEKPEYVFLAAAKVGGILANNTYRAQFIYENLMIQNNIIHQSYIHGVKKLLFLGSSCIYPKTCPQPMKEEYLLTGVLESTNEPYAIAKIAGIKMCESYYRQYRCNFISVMPTNLYGPNDNFNLETSHVLPAIIRKIHLGKCLENNDWKKIQKDLNKRPIEGITGNSAKEDILRTLQKYGIVIAASPNGSFNSTIHPFSRLPVNVNLWGSGKVYREFLHVHDMVDACVFLMKNIDAPKLYNDLGESYTNVGTGKEISIQDAAHLIKANIGFKGDIIFNLNKLDGTTRKLLDVSMINKFGWKHTINIQEGIEQLYNWYLN